MFLRNEGKFKSDNCTQLMFKEKVVIGPEKKGRTEWREGMKDRRKEVGEGEGLF